MGNEESTIGKILLGGFRIAPMPFIPFDACIRLKPFFGDEWKDWFELLCFIFFSGAPYTEPFELA